MFDVLVFEAARDGVADALRNDARDAGVDVERRADNAREKSDEPYCSEPSSPCAESEISVSVTCIDFFEVQSVRIMMAPAARADRKLAGTFSLSAPMSMAVAGVAGDAVGVEAGHGHADEVHQVVAGEGEGQREGSGQDRDAQDVDFEPLDEEEQRASDHPARKSDRSRCWSMKR